MNLNKQATESPDTSYRIIPLTQNQVALVDASDYEWISSYSWFAIWSPMIASFYAGRKPDKARGEKGRSTILMHRQIMNAPKGIHVDHIHHKTLDNRRSQLRLATHTQNQQNRRMHKNNKLGLRGVSYHKRDKLYSASITIPGRKSALWLGYFDRAEDAAAVYEAAALYYRGQFHNPSELVTPAATFEVKKRGMMKKRNTSGYLNVSFSVKKGKWYYQIRINGKQRLGRWYDTAEAAWEAYQKAVAERDKNKPK